MKKTDKRGGQNGHKGWRNRKMKKKADKPDGQSKNEGEEQTE